MKRKHTKKCHICDGEGIITRDPGLKSEYYEPCECNKPKEEDPDSYYENERDNNL